MKTYHVEYLLYANDNARGIDVLAKSKEDAYRKAVYEDIPNKEKESPYSAWVSSVTYNNGNYRTFNTFSGKPL